MFTKFSISGINALPRFGTGGDFSLVKMAELRPVSTNIGLYIHIPFCKTICRFCMLRRGSKAVQSVPQNYVELLIDEIKLHKSILNDVKISSFYFGGGTPSMLSAKQFENILDALLVNFSISETMEITFEGEPASLNKDSLLKTLKANGVGRISFGLQTFDPDMRELLGRTDSVDDIVSLVKNLSRLDFKEINIDYLYNLPGTNVDYIRKDFSQLRKLNVTSIDCHPLKYISCSGFMLQDIVDKKLAVPTATQRIDMFQFIRETIMDKGFTEQFVDQYSKYDRNQTNRYMRNLYGLDGGEYIGLGPGARSHFGNHGFTKRQNIHEYEDSIKAGEIPVDRAVYAPMLDNYITCFPKRNDTLQHKLVELSTDADYFKKILTELSVSGYLIMNESDYRLTDKGLAWYQNLQELLLSGEQRRRHNQNVMDRVNKFSKFNNYFEELGITL